MPIQEFRDIVIVSSIPVLGRADLNSLETWKGLNKNKKKYPSTWKDIGELFTLKNEYYVQFKLH